MRVLELPGLPTTTAEDDEGVLTLSQSKWVSGEGKERPALTSLDYSQVLTAGDAVEDTDDDDKEVLHQGLVHGDPIFHLQVVGKPAVEALDERLFVLGLALRVRVQVSNLHGRG